jgi:hypothetical protein
MQHTQKVCLCLPLSLTAEQVFVSRPVNLKRLQSPLHCTESPCGIFCRIELVGVDVFCDWSRYYPVY